MTPLLIGGAAFGAVILLALFGSFCFRKVVDTNEVHIVQSGKTSTVYGKDQEAGNVYYHWPEWFPLIGVRKSDFPVSNFAVRLDGYEAYDKGRLPFQVDVMAFFRVDDPTLAAKYISSYDELKVQLTGILQGACRTILATSEIEQILEGRSEFGTKFTEEVDANLTNWGVRTVKNIEFMDIRDSKDSKVIHQIMAKKQSEIDKESRVAVALNNREADLKEIEAKQSVKLRDQEAQEAVGIREAQKNLQIGLAGEKQKQDIASEAAVTTARQMEVSKVELVQRAEIEKNVQIVFAQQQQETQMIEAETVRKTRIVAAEGQKTERIIAAEGEKTQQVTQAEGQKESQVIRAEGAKQAALLNAESIEAEGVARGKAEEAILMAPVNTQIALATEIGDNEGYQTYLIRIKEIDSIQAVGIEQAKALANADIKVIANAGDASTGLKSALEVFSPKGGTQIAGALEALAQSDVGKNLLGKLTSPPKADS